MGRRAAKAATIATETETVIGTVTETVPDKGTVVEARTARAAMAGKEVAVSVVASQSRLR